MNAKMAIKNNEGITLVEVLVAVILIAFIMLSVFAAITQGAVFAKRIDTIYAALNIAQMRVDELKRFDFQKLHPAAEETDIMVDQYGNMDEDGEYMRTTEITTPYDSNSYLMKVKVTVDKIKIYINGTRKKDPIDGRYQLSGSPVVIETLFSDTAAN